LIGRAGLREETEDLLDLGRHARWDDTTKGEADFGDPEDAIDLFDVTFDSGGDVLGGVDLTRFQRAGKSAGQSPRNTGDDVVEGCRVIGAT
jgi:hypothetical protein